MDRQQHLQWCKDRALEYLPDNPSEAVASMMSDLRNHDELANHIGIEMGMMLLMGGHLESVEKVREWIVGFN